MSTLLLQFKAPMQSWGISAKFDTRYTDQVPSKSAVIGMIAGALGRRRNESVDDLNVVRFGVRVDCSGKMFDDFQTVQSYKDSLKRITFDNPTISQRKYLADAAFLVGLEGDAELLKSIEYALKHPFYPIFLGRRSCPPEGRLVLGIRDASLLEALKAEPWIAEDKERGDKVRFVLDALPDEEESYILRDNAVSFDQNCRRFGFRRIRDIREDVECKSDNVVDREPDTEHDPMSDLL